MLRFGLNIKARDQKKSEQMAEYTVDAVEASRVPADRIDETFRSGAVGK